MRLVRLCENVYVTEEGWLALKQAGLFGKPTEKLMAYEVQVTFKITKDGQGFHETNLKYENMAYEDVVQMEKFGAAAIAQLTAFGEERTKEKSGKK